jgi:hypothetical protein
LDIRALRAVQVMLAYLEDQETRANGEQPFQDNPEKRAQLGYLGRLVLVDWMDYQDRKANRDSRD